MTNWYGRSSKGARPKGTFQCPQISSWHSCFSSAFEPFASRQVSPWQKKVNCIRRCAPVNKGTQNDWICRKQLSSWFFRFSCHFEVITKRSFQLIKNLVLLKISLSMTIQRQINWARDLATMAKYFASDVAVHHWDKGTWGGGDKSEGRGWQIVGQSKNKSAGVANQTCDRSLRENISAHKSQNANWPNWKYYQMKYSLR